jgi:hypothetical protein
LFIATTGLRRRASGKDNLQVTEESDAFVSQGFMKVMVKEIRICKN